MALIMTEPTDIDEYISGSPPEVQKRLQQIRKTVKKAAPLAQETISYGMPAFMFHCQLVFFSAFKGHIGFYAPADRARGV